MRALVIAKWREKGIGVNAVVDANGRSLQVTLENVNREFYVWREEDKV